MPKKQTIPTEIQEEVLKIVEEFNRKTFTGEQNPILKALLGETQRGFPIQNAGTRRDLKASSFILIE
jgi:hypothetical protein